MSLYYHSSSILVYRDKNRYFQIDLKNPKNSHMEILEHKLYFDTLKNYRIKRITQKRKIDPDNYENQFPFLMKHLGDSGIVYLLATGPGKTTQYDSLTGICILPVKTAQDVDQYTGRFSKTWNRSAFEICEIGESIEIYYGDENN